uniref:Uncharacterized protein n=1 Tax=Prolemur simus TaxID=1328070 RepID=A0A8C9B6M1_PROSS
AEGVTPQLTSSWTCPAMVPSALSPPSSYKPHDQLELMDMTARLTSGFLCVLSPGGWATCSLQSSKMREYGESTSLFPACDPMTHRSPRPFPWCPVSYHIP